MGNRESKKQGLTLVSLVSLVSVSWSLLVTLVSCKQQAQQMLRAAWGHVLSRRDQQLLVVESLRQLAAPQKIAELDAIEKQLRNVRSDSETGKALILPANFSENIDARLAAIAKNLSH